MSKTKELIGKTKERNLTGAKNASFLKLGKEVNLLIEKQLDKLLKKQFGILGWKTAKKKIKPFIPLIIANSGGILLDTFGDKIDKKYKEKVSVVVDAMVTSAMYEGVDSFDINELIEGVLSKINIPENILNTEEESEEENEKQ